MFAQQVGLKISQKKTEVMMLNVPKARNTFRMLNNVWKSSEYSTKTKLRLYQNCVISTLLYGSECWRMTETDLNKLSTFHTKNLTRIL